MSAGSYASIQDATASPRDIEIRVLHTVNGLLAASGEDVIARATALNKVHRMWSIMLSDLTDERNGLPADLKGKLISLGIWAQRESAARMTDTASLQPLIALHRDLAEGLQAQPRAVPPTTGHAMSA